MNLLIRFAVERRSGLAVINDLDPIFSVRKPVIVVILHGLHSLCYMTIATLLKTIYT